MNILKLWLSSWKSVPSDAAAAAELIGRTAVAGTGSRLFSLINSVVSSGSMGIMMLSMTVTTMLSAASITYDIFVNEDSPLQVQEAEFDTGVITDEEGNFLPIVYTDEHGNVVASTEFAHSAQTGQGLSLMDLMQAIAEPDEVFTAYEPWVPDEQWMVDSGLWTEDEVRTLFVSLDLPPPVFNDTSREVSLNIPDASDTPNEIITPEVTTATPEITTTPEVTITEPVVGDDDSVVPEVTTTTPEVTTTTPEVTTTAPEVTTTAPEVTTTTPAITTTTAPPLTTTTTAPITTTTSPPTTTTTSPPRPPVTTAPPQLAQESLTLTAPNDITAFTFGQAPIQLEQGGGSGTGAVTYTSSDTNIITISNSGFVSFERVGTATITVTKAASGNYLAASAELELTVTKRDLSLLQIGAIPAVIYSGFPHTPLPTLTDGGLITAADYTLSYSNNVSTGTATVTITAADSGNYTGSRAVSFTINKAEPNYILPTGLTAVYGDLLSDIALPEGWAWVSPSASVGNAGARSHSATFTHIDTDNFNAITRSISVTVAKAETDYILPTGLTATYGDLLSSVALPAGWAWDSPSSTVGNAGSRSHSATFTPQDSVNFNLVTRSVSITIARAEPNVTPPTGLSAAFGELLSDVALPSGWAWDSPADSVGGIGTRSFSATYTPDDIANFTIIETDLNLTVNPASPSAPNMPTEASQTSTSVTLAAPSGANPLFALEYGMNTTNSPPVSWQDSLVFTGLAESGTYFFFARYKADPDRNYASAASVALEISPQKIAQAPLTVTGAPATITFGDLAFTLIVSGGSGTGGITFASSDTSVVSVDSMSGFVMIEGAGTATITVTKASDDIYNARSEEVPIVIAQGTLTGTPTAADITTYGGLLSTSAITGAVHSQHSVPIAGAWNWNTPTVIPAYGTTQYTATFTPTSPVNQAGYETLSATINVTVLNKADPDYTLPTGLSAFYGELLSSVTLPTGWAWASPTTAVGNVATSPNTHSATFTPDDTDNYNVLTRDVSVAIAKAAQTLTLTAPGDITTFAYGHAQVQLTRSNGLGTGAYSFSSSDTDVITVSNTGFVSFERAGAATITVTKAECENYLAASAEITLTVGKIAPTLLDLTFALTSVTYDGTQQSISVTSTASGIGAITVLYDGSPTVPINADTYEISANIAEGDNYTAVTLTLGDFIISPRTLTITATGTLSPIDPVTLTITGVIGSDTVPLTTPDFAVTGTTMTIHVASTVPNVANQIPFTTTNTNYTIPNTTAVNIRDGRAAGREIPVTQANIAQFNTFARGLDGRGRHYILTENVTLSGTWTPIGSFGGGFDGDGYTISNLTINAITLDQGMFSSIAVGGVVKNLGLVNVNITSTTNWVGGVAASSGGTISNCFVTGAVSGANFVGGITGGGGGRVENSVSLVTMVNRTSGAGANFGRMGGNDTDTFVDNYAWSGTLVRGAMITTGTTTDRDGQNITRENVATVQALLDGVFNAGGRANSPDLQDFLPPIIAAVSGDMTGEYESLTLAFDAISARGAGVYTVTISQDQTLANRIIGAGQNITIQSNNATVRTVQYNGAANQPMFYANANNASLTLGNNITIRGIDNGTVSLISFEGGTFTMQSGSTVTGHTTSSIGGAVYLGGSTSTANINGGTISGNNPVDIAIAHIVQGNDNGLRLSGDSQIGSINLNGAGGMYPRVWVLSGFEGNVAALNLHWNLSTVADTVTQWTANTNPVLAGTGVNTNTVARITLGEFLNTNLTQRQPISNTHFIAADGFLRAYGSEHAPFIIADEDDLRKVGTGTDGWGLNSHYRLDSDITLTQGNWATIGGIFAGTFDGGGHAIRNLTGTNGIFDTVTGTVRDLGLVDVNITGTAHLGGITGNLNAGGVITRCYVTGAIVGNNTHIGGIVGANRGTISNCYTTADVTGSGGVGGIAGGNIENGRVEYCYALGNIIGVDIVGGLVGVNTTNATRNSVALNPSITRSSGAAGAFGRVCGSPVAGMNNYARQDMVIFVTVTPSINQLHGANITVTQWTDLDWWQNTAFVGISAEDWAWWQQHLPPTLPLGSPCNPFIIVDEDDLRKVGRGADGMSLSAHYKLEADINLLQNWSTIDGDFTGVFDGNGHTIADLSSASGMFNQISGTVMNLRLENATITATVNRAGTLAMQILAGGTVKNISASGTVTSTANVVGGLVGSNSGTIENCYSSVDVSGGTNVGGIVGSNVTGSVIRNTYSTGTITGEENTGGIVGSSPTNTTSNSVALNSSITRSGGAGTAFGRVFASAVGSTNNYARQDMAFAFTFTPAINNGNGANITHVQWTDLDWWQNTAFVGISAVDWAWWVDNNHLPPTLPLGSSECNPFIITDEAQLRAIGTGDFTLSAYYKLGGSIALTSVWTPIGSFNGVFDGAGFTISGLEITAGSDRGFFGGIGENGIVKRLGVEGTVDGGGTGDRVGGIAGTNRGIITDCFFVGSVTGRDHVGGIAGQNFPGGVVEFCYAMGTVTGTANVGGIVGFSNAGGSPRNAEIKNTVALQTAITGGNRIANTTSVTFTSNYAYAGMLVNGGIITNGLSNNVNGENINGTNRTTVQSLLNLINPNNGINLDFFMPPDGTGARPFLVTNEADLKQVGTGTAGWELDKHYRMTGNIVLTGTNNWTRIGATGVAENGFRGTFDGNGYTITGLHMTGLSSVGQGMFAVVRPGGVVKNLGLINPTVISTGTHVGAIAGEVGGTVENCFVIGGSVSGGNTSIGGITGNAAATGIVRNNVVLLNNVTSTGTTVGRVSGTNSGGNSGNHAFSGMLINNNLITDGTSTNTDGANITPTNYAAIQTRLTETFGANAPDISPGTMYNPFLIYTEADLRAVGRDELRGGYTWAWDSHYKMMSNITLTSDWEAIGSLKGTFNGNGFTISNLTIPSGFFIGMFGSIQTEGVVENLGLIDVDINGAIWIGGIAGMNYGTIRNCFVTGTINGSGVSVGGIAGEVDIFDGVIENCVSLLTEISGNLPGRVKGDALMGATLANNYAFSGTLLNGDPATTDITLTSRHGANITAANFNTVQAMLNSVFGANAPNLNNYMPLGSAQNPFKINTEAQLRQVGSGTNGWSLDSYYRLEANIDLTNSPGWIPIPDNWTNGWSASNAFSGVFDGGGNTITGLTIDTTEGNVGMFSFIDFGGEVKNLHLADVDIAGDFLVGGLVGYMEEGTVSNVSVTGNITAGDMAGGIAGQTSYLSVIRNSYSAVNIYSDSGVSLGGIAGDNCGGTIEYCYASGDIIGSRQNGGIVGFIDDGTVRNNVALNGKVINLSTQTTVGRVAGRIRSGFFGVELQNNFAFSGMMLAAGNIIEASETTLDGKDGLGVTSAQWNDLNWWRNTAFSGISQDDWDWWINNSILPPTFSAGTPQNPHQISQSNIAWFNTHANTKAGLNEHYILTENIVLPTVAAGQSNWTPIGADLDNWEDLFRGSFNGNGHTITNLTIYEPAVMAVGMFGIVADGGAVRNLGLINVDITGDNSVGGIAVFTEIDYFGGTIENCFVTGKISGDIYVGGIVARAANYSPVRNNVSLLESITASNDGVFRVADAYRSSSDVSNNYAYSGMALTEGGAPKTATSNINGNDGANITPANVAEVQAMLNNTFGANAPDLTTYLPPLGSADNPFTIGTEADLRAVGRGTYNGMNWSLTAHYKLESDIDLTGTGNFTAIGGNTDGAGFRGTFDGNNHTITGMTINATAATNGMFRHISATGVVRNLNLVNVNVTSTFNTIGAIAGTNGGIIERVSVSGTVRGASNIGGIAGMCLNDGTPTGNPNFGIIRNSYSSADVSGSASNIGGIVGDMRTNNRVQNTYSTGRVEGVSQVGGIAGNIGTNSTIENSVALNSGVFRISGTATTIARICDMPNNFVNRTNNYARSDLPATPSLQPGSNGDDITNQWQNASWWQNTVFTGISANDWAWWQTRLPQTIPDVIGSAAAPFIITTEAQLRQVGRGNNGMTLSAHYKLEDDIDLTSTWTTIPNTFTGSFDGNGHVITGLTGFNGLFNAVSGTVMNVGVVNVSINSTASTHGGIAGTLNAGGTISGCYVTGTMTFMFGGNGGLVGQNSGIIENSYSTADVMCSAGNWVGGIVGRNHSGGIVRNCYSTGIVSGTAQVGGIVGDNNGGSIINCAALNPSLERSGTGTATTLGRITGQSTGTLTDNHAFSGMTVIGAVRTSTNANSNDGADITETNIAEVQAMLNTTFGANAPDLENYLPKPTGSGTAPDPFLIYNEADLRAVGRGNAHNGGTWGLNSHYKLVNNITLEQGNWTPIGHVDMTSMFFEDFSNAFTGTFDGNGKTITGMTITDEEFAGMFSVLFDGAVVKNLGLIDVNISGEFYAGTIASCVFDSTIMNCFVTGIVASEMAASGITCAIEELTGTAVITNNIVLLDNISAFMPEVAFRIALDGGAVFTDNFASRSTTVNGVTRSSNFPNSEDGACLNPLNVGPIQQMFSAVFGENALDLYPYVFVATGTGTAADPFLIYNEADLRAVGRNGIHNGWTWTWTNNTHYKLMRNIELTSEWTPIPNFRGVFDGNGRTITGMTVAGGTSHRGLIGMLGTGGVVKNLGLIDVNVSGTNAVGTIAGYADIGATITNCFVTGVVNGNLGSIGGITGGLDDGMGTAVISGCVALLDSINGMATGTRRIANDAGGIFNNNFARADMLVNGAPRTQANANHTDGADVTAAELGDLSWWRSVGFASGVWFAENLPLGIVPSSAMISFDDFGLNFDLDLDLDCYCAYDYDCGFGSGFDCSENYDFDFGTNSAPFAEPPESLSEPIALPPNNEEEEDIKNEEDDEEEEEIQ